MMFQEFPRIKTEDLGEPEWGKILAKHVKFGIFGSGQSGGEGGEGGGAAGRRGAGVRPIR